MADETLRVYKYGSGTYHDITSATAGGFSDLVKTDVLGAAGSLTFTLTATTPAMFHHWLNELATVEYWEDGAKIATYTVDEYSPKWSALSCDVKCVGSYAAAAAQLYSGSFANVREWSLAVNDPPSNHVTEVGTWAWGYDRNNAVFGRTIEAAGSATIAFTGTAISVWFGHNVEQGIASITLDSGTPEEINLYDASQAWAPPSALWVHGAADYTATGLDDEAHELLIEWTGDDNGHNAHTMVNLHKYQVTRPMTGKAFLEELVALVAEWIWDPDKVLGCDFEISDVVYHDKPITDAIAEICLMGGVTYWIEPDGTFNAGEAAAVPTKTFTLGDNATEFDTTFVARAICNQLIIVARSGTYTFDDDASQAIYGVRSRKVEMTGCNSETQAEAYALAIFAAEAQPQLEMGLQVKRDDTLAVGMMAEVLGLADGRTYENVIVQITTTLGALFQEIRLGAQPVSLSSPDYDSSSGVPVAALREDVGALPDLQTTDKSSLVAAINENTGIISDIPANALHLLAGTIEAVNEDGTVTVHLEGETEARTNVPLIGYATENASVLVIAG